MLHSMENSFYPCDDFFLYSCGHSLQYEQQNEDNLIKQIQYKHEIDLKSECLWKESFSFVPFFCDEMSKDLIFLTYQ